MLCVVHIRAQIYRYDCCSGSRCPKDAREQARVAVTDPRIEFGGHQKDAQD